MNLAIVDVGCGNIGSVGIAFERFGLTPLITGDAQEIAAADRVILPGVGAAGYAMEQIEARGLKEPLRSLRQPVLGICLGMQLLFERSEEDDTQCLGIIPGPVRKLAAAPHLPVPHMGWSKLTLSPLPFKGGDRGVGASAEALACGEAATHDLSAATAAAPQTPPPPAPPLRGRGEIGLRTGDYVYFAHSYACDDGPRSLATANYGRPIAAVVRHANYLGAQFHPERSGEAGARFLEAFLDQ